MKGLLIYNSFLNTNKFTEHYTWLYEAAQKYGIELVKTGNATTLFTTDAIETESKIDFKEFDFVIFWDKDVYEGKLLSKKLSELKIPMYNCIEAIENCDDKFKTLLKVQDWNNDNKSSQIQMIPTIPAPMTYSGIGYDDLGFAYKVIEKLGLPVIIKECFGSFGAQVYIANNIKELSEKIIELSGKPFIFQKFIKKSAGFDVRLQVIGDEVVAAMYRYNEKGDFRANISGGGSMKKYHPSDKEKELAINSVKALGLDFAGVDMLFSRGKGYDADILCEINSNAHFKNISECTGVNVADKIIKYIVSRNID